MDRDASLVGSEIVQVSLNTLSSVNARSHVTHRCGDRCTAWHAGASSDWPAIAAAARSATGLPVYSGRNPLFLFSLSLSSFLSFFIALNRYPHIRLLANPRKRSSLLAFVFIFSRIFPLCFVSAKGCMDLFCRITVDLYFFCNIK